MKEETAKAVAAASTLHELDEVYRSYLGSKGKLSEVLRLLKDIPVAQRKRLGRQGNKLKFEVQELIRKRGEELRKEDAARLVEREWIDVTLPIKPKDVGHLHPLTLTIREIERIFGSMGFEVASGPDMETEYYNFDALQIPADHPARDLWDTFWVKETAGEKPRQPQGSSRLSVGGRLLLRTHTSPVQIRYMETHEPPLRIIVPGRCFRYEATSAANNFEFFQVEGLMVGREVNLAHLKGVLLVFFQKFFKKELALRFRPSFFPFTEPSVEVDITCLTCAGVGCSVCKTTGWLEMMGAGMVHPRVFETVGYNPKFVQGFAFGMGIDRLAMMKYKIDDIRLLYSGDLRFLKQF